MVNLSIDGLRHQFQQVPDPRSGGHTQFSFDDIGMAAFSVFFVQSPSFLDHQRKFHEARNRDACQSLFGMRRIPTDNHIRKQLDGIACQSVYPAFDMAIEQLTQHQGLKPFLRLDGRILIALDGPQFHVSENIHCSQCSTAPSIITACCAPPWWRTNIIASLRYGPNSLHLKVASKNRIVKSMPPNDG